MQDNKSKNISMRELREDDSLNVRVDTSIGSRVDDPADSGEVCETDIAGHKIARDAREMQGGCPLCGLTHTEERWTGRDNDPAYEDAEQIGARTEHLNASLEKIDQGQLDTAWFTQNRLQFCPRCLDLTGTDAETTDPGEVAQAIRHEIADLQERTARL